MSPTDEEDPIVAEVERSVRESLTYEGVHATVLVDADPNHRHVHFAFLPEEVASPVGEVRIADGCWHLVRGTVVVSQILSYDTLADVPAEYHSARSDGSRLGMDRAWGRSGDNWRSGATTYTVAEADKFAPFRVYVSPKRWVQ